jgi:hypothetical protein
VAAGRDGLLVATGYGLPVPVAPAFCVGNVIICRMDSGALAGAPALLAHEARHATQYAFCAGLPILPLYFAAAGVSWLLAGDFGAWNVFERRAGLADGGYTGRPVRPALRQLQLLRPPRRPAWPPRPRAAGSPRRRTPGASA